MPSWFTRPVDGAATVERQNPTLSHLQLTERRLVENTAELREAMRDLATASEFVKSEIRRLLLDREHKRVRFAALQAGNATLKQALGVCK